MTDTPFATALAAEHYTDIETRTLPPRPANVEHGHAFAVKGMVLEGVFTVIANEQATAFRQGEIFAVPANVLHQEEVGPDGAVICIGRKG